MNPTKKWAVIVPMANEEHDFYPFVSSLQQELDVLKNGVVFLIVDNVSKDKTLELCRHLSENDKRFHTVWAPENRNVVDAYIRGYKEALKNSDAEYIIEMDAGLSHDPATLGKFINSLDEGIQCVFGSRFIEGGSMGDSPAKRQSLSKTGTILSNMLLGTKLHDMTSGYQGFHRGVVEKFTSYQLRSKAHFYQTEIRYLLRKYPSKEIPIHYQAPSPRVSKKAITNSIETLLYYFWRRITFRSISI
ncbi:MAG: glycosyltransferase [Bacteroidota bacterium]